MISILIPIYNTEITDLVENLHLQCQKSAVEFEILCYDDFSSKKYKDKNKIISKYKNTVYKEMNGNQGRAKLRNILAMQAKYDTLLFLDADSQIIKDDFVKTYLKITDKNVVFGGRDYPDMAPDDKNKMLHWKYGKNIESIKADKRMEKPFLHFMSNNFIISKNIFHTVKFDENHKGYGYEDTLFAYALKREGINIHHIDNPVLHLGIEDTDVFLRKTKDAIRNLVILYKQGRLTDTRLISMYEKIKNTGLSGIYGKMINRFDKRIMKNLFSANPQLSLLQIYKLALFIEKMKER